MAHLTGQVRGGFNEVGIVAVCMAILEGDRAIAADREIEREFVTRVAGAAQDHLGTSEQDASPAHHRLERRC